MRTTQREQHYAVSATSETLVKVEYSDGFGRLLQTRAQAEDVLFGAGPLGESGLPARAGLPNQPAVGRRVGAGHTPVVVSGWQVYDNKGRVVEQYEPFFAQDFAFVAGEAAGQGQRVRLYYDPRGQLVRTVNPDGTEQRVLYGVPGAAGGLADLAGFAPSPWETYTYDANDLAPLTHAGQAAAMAVAAHWSTPQSAVVDALGRVVRTTDRLHPTDAARHVVMGYEYDIRGNRTRVTDALGRVSFAHVYDLRPKAGEDDPGANVLRTVHLDGGTRRALFDGAGQALQGTDAKGALTLHTYDALGRPTEAWARDQAGENVTRRQRLEYGANDAAGRAANAVGQPVAHYDEAGRVRVLGYDFKGNVLDQARQVVADSVFIGQCAAQAGRGWPGLPAGFNAHWDLLDDPANDPEVRLAPRAYQTTTEYDALNRATRVRLPHEAGQAPSVRPQLVPTYNRAGALAQVALDGQVLVARVAYNARGQRLLLARGNGLLTRYAYDAVSFRLRRLRTEGYAAAGETLTPQSGTVRQDTTYTYDLAGNIMATVERAPQSGVGGAAELERLFAYDALYRLLEATGRENQPTAATPWQDEVRSDGVASTTAYRQLYEYDLLGNIKQLRHVGQSRFTRTFDYGSQATNYLQSVQVGGAVLADYAYDANGNVLRETQGRHLSWDASDQLRQFATWTGTAGTAPTLLAYYLYNASGERTKKITQTGADTWQVSVYVGGGFEHRYEVSGGQTAEQTVVAVLDGQSRLYQRRGGDALDDQRPAELYTLEDHLGSATATVDAGGAVVSREEYYPFGETSFGSYAKQRYRFCGKERDQESGLYYYGMRYYAPWLCRFVSVDPLAKKYPFYSSYQYAGNKPVTFIDLDGLEPVAPPVMRSPMPFPMRPNVNTRNLARPRVNPGGQQQRTPIGVVTGPGYAYDSHGNKVPAPSYYVYKVRIDVSAPPVTRQVYEGTPQLYQTGNAPGFMSYESYARAYSTQKTELTKQKAIANSPFKTKEEKLVYVYRGGAATDINFTPRPIKDTGTGIKSGLSTFVTPEQAMQGTTKKAQRLDAQELIRLGFELNVAPDGHVGIRPASQAMLEEWGQSRPLLEQGGLPHFLTDQVRKAHRGQVP